MNVKNRLIISLAATVIMPIIFYYFWIHHTFLNAFNGNIIMILIVIYSLAWLFFLLIFVGTIACELDKRISNTNT